MQKLPRQWPPKLDLKKPAALIFFLAAFFVLSTSAFARMEPSSRAAQMLHYKEATSSGPVSADEPAKPAETDVYTRREAPGDEPEPALPKRVDSEEDGAPSPKKGKPKYREVYEQADKKESGYDKKDEVGVAIGINFGFNHFSGSLGLTFPINHYLAWGVAGNYYSLNEKTIGEIKTGGELALIFRVPNFTPLTPFLSAGPGYTTWKRSKDDGSGRAVFDDSSSPTADWALGASIRLARYVSLVAALKSTTYTDLPPKMFADQHTSREQRTKERFEFGFSFGF
jgi:hypothetical protein